jgi:UDP-N-acetylmuramyl tripeptide synthase
MTKMAIDILSQLQLQGAKIGGLSADSRALHAGDVVLIAGKGHEDYQESAGRRIPFLDAAVAAEALAAWTQ